MWNAIGEGSVKTLVDDIKLAEVLVMGWYWESSQHLAQIAILQYRMQEDLPTFFYFQLFNFQDLEKHFAKGKNGNDETLGKLDGSWKGSAI